MGGFAESLGWQLHSAPARRIVHGEGGWRTMFRNRHRRPVRDPRVAWLAIGQRVTRRRAKKREAEACDRQAQLAEQKRQTPSDSVGLRSVDVFRDSTPVRPGKPPWDLPVDLPEARQPPPSPVAGDADGGSKGALDGVRGVAVARMRFCEIPDAAASVVGWRGERRSIVRARLVVELQIASVPADERGSFDAVLRMSLETLPADDVSERLVGATAEYFADTADNQVRILFETPGSLGPEEVSAVLDRCQQKLLDLVKAPVEQLATLGGAPPLAAELAGGIGADFVLDSEIRLEEGISAIIDICVIGIGSVTGQPHLVAVAIKHLSRTGFHEAVQRGASKILEGLRKPAAPAAPELARHVTLPGEIELDLRQPASPGHKPSSPRGPVTPPGPGDEPHPSPGGF